jgi:hypothetical protein
VLAATACCGGVLASFTTGFESFLQLNARKQGTKKTKSWIFIFKKLMR